MKVEARRDHLDEQRGLPTCRHFGEFASIPLPSPVMAPSELQISRRGMEAQRLTTTRMVIMSSAAQWKLLSDWSSRHCCHADCARGAVLSLLHFFVCGVTADKRQNFTPRNIACTD